MPVEIVTEVHRVSDPVERNRVITAGYHRLSEEMATKVGRSDANWLTFGTWASFSAGRFIRGEVAPVRWGADSVAEGNMAIICDVGPRFERFLRLCESVAPKHLVEAVSEDDLLTESRQLAEAFSCYAEVCSLRDSETSQLGEVEGRAPRNVDASSPLDSDRQRAELLLRANILIGHHEQYFADSFIDDAIPLGGLAGILGTRFVKITIPEGDLDVCQDVPRPRYLNGRQWPEVLTGLADRRLLGLLDEYGQDPASTRHSNAPTWESFEERMGFIACFFRAYQRDQSLYQRPPGLPPVAAGVSG